MQLKLIHQSLLGIVSTVLLAVSLSSAAAPWPPVLVNPKPIDDDFILPLPCDGEMVFRKIELPVLGVLSDHSFILGGVDSEWDYAEHKRKSYISGSFEDQDGQYYYIAKYEVNRLQYEAVMNKECSKPTPLHRLPQTNISWFDAIEFSNRLSVWLMENAEDNLPTLDETKAFVRLPTETEWEFAARGGMKVSNSQFADRMFFMEGDISEYVWFSGVSSSNGKLQMTGLKKPNPQGIHDIVGNAAEMTQELFQLNKVGRMHGKSGGIVVRGGNYRTAREEIRISERTEAPLYANKQEYVSSSTGFRPVLGTVTLGSLEKIQAIRKSWNELGQDVSGRGEIEINIDSNAMLEKKADGPIQELELIAEAIQNEEAKGRLLLVRDSLKSSLISRDEQRDRAIKSALRLGSFLCANLHNASKVVDARRRIYDSQCSVDSATSQCDSYQDRFQSEEASMRGNLVYYSDTIIQTALDYSSSVIDRQNGILRREMEARNSSEIADWADVYVRQVKSFSENGKIKREGWLANCKAGIGP